MQNIKVGPVSVAFFINKIRPAFKKGKRTIQLQVRRRPSKGLKKIEVKKCTCLCTLISLINVKSRLLILKKNPPSTFIDFLDLFHPPLLVYCIYLLVVSKKSHPPRLLKFHSYSILPGKVRLNFSSNEIIEISDFPVQISYLGYLVLNSN